MHTANFKYVTDDFPGKNILIVGGGESASHIAQELAPVARSCYWSIRNGQWFQDRHSGMLAPADMRFSRAARLLMGNSLNRFVAVSDAVNGLTGFTWGGGGSGVPEWMPKSENVMQSWANKDRGFKFLISCGRITPKRGIKSVEKRTVVFDDGESGEFDVIVCATGFRPSRTIIDMCSCDVYKHVFLRGDPTISRVGFIRPTIGSVTNMAEMQARWVASVISGKCSLPRPEQMAEEIAKDKARRAREFPKHHDRQV